MRKRNKGKMVEVSQYKLMVHGMKIKNPDECMARYSLSREKMEKISKQVLKCIAEQDVLRKYQPFTSGLPKRKPTQVQ